MSEDEDTILPPNINSPLLPPQPVMPTPGSRKRPALQDPDQSMVVQQTKRNPKFVNHEAERLRKENAELKAELAGLRAQLTAMTKTMEGLQKSFNEQGALLRERLTPAPQGNTKPRPDPKGKKPDRTTPTRTREQAPAPAESSKATATPAPTQETPRPQAPNQTKPARSYADAASRPPPQRKSIQERAKALRPDASEEELAATALSLSRVHAVRSLRGPIERKHGLCRVYADGFTQMPISELKGHFKQFHFVITKIRNIAFVSNTTVEFLVQPDYLARFKRDLKKGEWKILNKYDPSVPINKEVSEETRARIANAFHNRVVRLATTGTRDDVKSFFASWATSLSLPLTTAQVPGTDTEMQEGAPGTPEAVIA